MITSPALSLAFTALFVITGGWALVRLAQVVTGRGAGADVVAELSHLGMGVAMIAMTWGVVTGPTGPGGVATLVVFGVAAAWAVVRLTHGRRRHRPAVTAYHLVMAASMVWMVAAMPSIMGVTGDSGPEMTGMPGMAGMPVHGPVTPVWVTALTWVFVLLLVASATLWTLRAFRSVIATDEVPHAPPAPAAGGTVAVAQRPLTTPTLPLAACRLDACCHALTSLGMAGMIVVML